MTTQPGPEPFTFETSYDSSSALPGAEQRKRKLGLIEDQLFVAFAVFGALCLLWRYTIALGVFVLGMTTFAWTMRERSRTLHKRLGPSIEPPTRMQVRVTESGYSVRGDDFFAETSWNRMIFGSVTGGYLLVHSSRAPRVYLSIDEMERAGVYARIKTIVDARSAETKAAMDEARRRSRPESAWRHS